MPPSAPRVPRPHESGCPAGFLSFLDSLIDQFINSIDFVADEDVVDVADETLGWE